MDLPLIIIVVAVLIFSVILHELSHGYMALWFGDPTARLAGRLTLNPLPHLDLVGSILLPAILALSSSGFIVGWAKPVPYNPYNLQNQRWGEVLVAFAGPATNILIALVFGFLIRFAGALFSPAAVQIIGFIVFINILLAFFNLIPIPPLDGSKVVSAFLPFGALVRYNQFRASVERYGLIAVFAFFFIFIYFLAQPFFALVSFIFRLITGTGLF